MTNNIKRCSLILSFALVFFYAPGQAAGQDGSNSDSTGPSFVRPLIGYVFDAGAGQIRTIAGTPGAARVAEAVTLDTAVQQVLIRPAGSYAVASAPAGATLMLIRGLDSQAASTPITGSIANFKSGAFSPSGASAILYGSECACVQIITGFPDSPGVSRTIDATGLPGDVAALAVNDTSSLAAVAISGSKDGSSSGQVLVFNINTTDPASSISASAPAAIAFSPSGKDLAIVDAGNRLLSVAYDVAGGGAILNILGEADGLTTPAAVAFASGNLLLTGDSAGQTYLTDLQTNQTTSVSCYCKPSIVEPTALKSTYRLTGIDTGALWILTIGDTDAHALFVPVDANSGGVTQAGSTP
jgi:hypothetical protein